MRVRGRLLRACPARVPRAVANQQSTLAEGALTLYNVEREAKDLQCDWRPQLWRPRPGRRAADLLHAFLIANRQKVPDGSATIKTIDYKLKRWAALARYIDDGDLAPDNHRIGNLIQPIALGWKNWHFAGSLRAGQRAAVVMT